MLEADKLTTLRAMRHRKDLSLEEVGKHFDIHPTTVSAWEIGKHEPSLHQIKELAKLYEQPFFDVIEAVMHPVTTLGRSRPKRRKVDTALAPTG